MIIRDKYRNINLLNVHYSNEGNDEAEKQDFYMYFRDLDFSNLSNGKIGKEIGFDPAIGKRSKNIDSDNCLLIEMTNNENNV